MYTDGGNENTGGEDKEILEAGVWWRQALAERDDKRPKGKLEKTRRYNQRRQKQHGPCDLAGPVAKSHRELSAGDDDDRHLPGRSWGHKILSLFRVLPVGGFVSIKPGS